jgi:hypothetical protein
MGEHIVLGNKFDGTWISLNPFTRSRWFQKCRGGEVADDWDGLGRPLSHAESCFTWAQWIIPGNSTSFVVNHNKKQVVENGPYCVSLDYKQNQKREPLRTALRDALTSCPPASINSTPSAIPQSSVLER